MYGIGLALSVTLRNLDWNGSALGDMNFSQVESYEAVEMKGRSGVCISISHVAARRSQSPNG